MKKRAPLNNEHGMRHILQILPARSSHMETTLSFSLPPIARGPMFLLAFVAQSKSDWKTTVFLKRLKALQPKALPYDKNKCHQSCVLESHNFSSCPVAACRKVTKLLFNSCNLYSHHATSSQVTRSFSKYGTISACQAISFQVTQKLLSLATFT